MDQHIQWFETFRKSKEYQIFLKRPIAYFCAEMALAEDSPTYAGGLGVLAGDTIWEAAEQKIPLVAVGMYYHEGYLHHELYSDGIMLKHPMRRTPQDFGFRQVMTAENQPLTVSIPLEGRQLKIGAWEMQKGTVRVFLLDTDIIQNDQTDRSITNRLYVANKETRFKQEMVLGIGGLRLLEALKIHPMIYHLNEGHSALLALEIAFHEMKEYGKNFIEELDRAKHHIVFTNHTLVAAGNDTFNNDMASALLSNYSEQVRVPVHQLTSLGLVQESSIFSMSILALRMAHRINAVSKLHAKKAKDIWADHPMSAITNGIHVPLWDAINDKEHMWEKHIENKKALLTYVHKKTGQKWDENDLVIGWARRMVGYKRPLALFQDIERLKKLVKDTKRPLRVVMAGSAHESDFEGSQMLAELQRLIVTELDGYVVYIPDYNLKVGKLMTTGCDVWLNTPVVGFEACGTSGMKACLNGVLPLTTKDGWVDEVDLYKIGWYLDDDAITDSLLGTLEQHILPMYYERNAQGIPEGWLENMHNARELILNEYSATRMLQEYISTMYLQCLSSLEKDNE